MYSVFVPHCPLSSNRNRQDRLTNHPDYLQNGSRLHTFAQRQDSEEHGTAQPASSTPMDRKQALPLRYVHSAVLKRSRMLQYDPVCWEIAAFSHSHLALVCLLAPPVLLVCFHDFRFPDSSTTAPRRQHQHAKVVDKVRFPAFLLHLHVATSRRPYSRLRPLRRRCRSCCRCLSHPCSQYTRR